LPDPKRCRVWTILFKEVDGMPKIGIIELTKEERKRIVNNDELITKVLNANRLYLDIGVPITSNCLLKICAKLNDVYGK